jgi:rhamnose utilization protein RhaD (predicted bifunctional aldolase and dehydrogenase)
VERTTRALDRAIHRPADLGGRATEPLRAESSIEVLAEVLPVFRGALSTGTPGVVLHVDRSTDVVEFASSVRGRQLTELGPGCPDHMVTVGYRPLALEPIRAADDTATRAVLDDVESHRRWYNAYYDRHITDAGRTYGRRSDAPHAVLLPGIGIGAVSSGVDAARARLCADHTQDRR